MKRSHTILRGCGFVSWAILGLVGMALGAGPAEKPAEKSGKSPPVPSAERDVQRWLAELKGRQRRGDAALGASSGLSDPNYSGSARWQSGYVRIDGKWLLGVLDAEAKYKTDRNLADSSARP